MVMRIDTFFPKFRRDTSVMIRIRQCDWAFNSGYRNTVRPVLNDSDVVQVNIKIKHCGDSLHGKC
jgi:hypothetical protein